MPPDVPFGSAAERYDALRPSYPDAAVAWALADAPAGDVADVLDMRDDLRVNVYR